MVAQGLFFFLDADGVIMKISTVTDFLSRKHNLNKQSFAQKPSSFYAEKLCKIQ